LTRGKSWEPEDKLQAAFTYVLTGSVLQTSQVTGIPERTIKDWTQTDWFQVLMAEAKERKQEELDGKWTGLIHLIADKLEERILKGDPVIHVKTGTVTYIPVKARDLALVQGIISDKRAANRRAEMVRVAPPDGSHLDEIQEKLGKVVTAEQEEAV